MHGPRSDILAVKGGSLLILYQQEFIPEEQVHISHQDRGYYFGDGVYEVFRVYQGQIFEKDAHMRRLARSAAEVRIRLPYEIGLLETNLEKLMVLNRLQDGMIYLQITRGVAPRVHAFPAGLEPVLLAYCKEIRRPIEGMRDGIQAVMLEDIRWHRCDIKSLNLLPNILAKQEAEERQAGEAIFHRNGTVTECSASNVMMVKNGEIYTHPANNWILHGVTRGFTLKLAAELGIAVHEQAASVEEFMRADEVFITNTTMEVTPVVSIDGSPVGGGQPGPVTRRLQAAFERQALK